MKAAIRYLRCDGAQRKAIVVSSDIAEYARGSSGEQTQGAGAVAFLLEADPKIAAVDLESWWLGFRLSRSGLPQALRAALHRGATHPETEMARDFPVFNGKYSTICYLDAVVKALDDMFHKNEIHRPRAFYDSLGGAFFHRPYHRMPIQAMAAAALWGMVQEADLADELKGLCGEAEADYETVVAEVRSRPELFKLVQEKGPDHDPTPEASKVVRFMRSTPWFKNFVAEKFSLGDALVRELGNLYTASLPAWLAAGLQDAAERELDLDGKTLLTVGYGSGDAAEAIPLRMVDGWQDAARRTRFKEALADVVDLSREQYEAMHDGNEIDGLDQVPPQGFFIERRGAENAPKFQDIGIDYYRFH